MWKIILLMCIFHPIYGQAHKYLIHVHRYYHQQIGDDDRDYQTSIRQHYPSNDNSYQHQQQQSEGDYYQRATVTTLQPIYSYGGNFHLQTTGNWQYFENTITEYYTGCPAGHTGQLPYANDCRQFLICWNGKGEIQTCSLGTVFNPEILECDYAAKVKCEAALGALDVQYVEKSSTPIHEILEQSTQSNYEPVRHSDDANDLCPLGAEGLQPHQTDCTRFINCSNGNTHIQQCGPGTAYSIDTQNCDFIYKVDCAGREGEDAPRPRQAANGEIFCPSDASGFYAHLHDCTKYVNCVNGVTYIHDCGPDSGFDSARLLCDHKYKVKCCSDCGWPETATESIIVTTESIHLREGPTDTSDHLRNDIFYCPRELFGVYPHPFNNAKYLKCVYGELYEKSCKSGHVYNFITKFCEEHIERNREVLPPTQIRYGNESIIEKRSNDSLIFLKCPLNLEGNFVHPYNCSQYINCSPFGTKIESCPDDSYFNLQRERCVSTSKMSDFEHVECITSDENVDTGASYSIPLGIYCTTNKIETFPYPHNWHQYVLCENGKLKIKWCPPKQVFIFEELQCIDETKALENY